MTIYEAQLIYNPVGKTTAPQMQKCLDFVNYMDGAFDSDPMTEQMFVIFCNTKNIPVARQMVSKGTVDRALVGVPEIFRPAILNGCKSMCLVHNHPSGDPTPSKADMDMTQKLAKAAKTLDIRLLDHIIIGEKDSDPNGLGYYSFLEGSLYHLLQAN